MISPDGRNVHIVYSFAEPGSIWNMILGNVESNLNYDNPALLHIAAARAVDRERTPKSLMFCIMWNI